MREIVNNYQEIKEIVLNLEADIIRYEKYQEVATGRRVSSTYRKLRDLCEEQKKEVQYIRSILS